MNAREKLIGWYHDWNRAKYLSRFECWLNRSLWLLLVIALMYSIFQHVVLANVTERFRGGARLGEVGYDLAIAYAGAFEVVPVFVEFEVAVPHLRPAGW